MRNLALVIFILLTGCATYVDYSSNPPGAYVTFQTTTGVTAVRYLPTRLEYPGWTDEYRNGGCMTVTSPTATWPDGISASPTLLRLCRNEKSHIFSYTFSKPQNQINSSVSQSGNLPSGQVQKDPYTIKDKDVVNDPVKTKNVVESSLSPEMEVAKKKCSDLGFKSGSEQFGKCVLQLSK